MLPSVSFSFWPNRNEVTWSCLLTQTFLQVNADCWFLISCLMLSHSSWSHFAFNSLPFLDTLQCLTPLKWILRMMLPVKLTSPTFSKPHKIQLCQYYHNTMYGTFYVYFVWKCPVYRFVCIHPFFPLNINVFSWAAMFSALFVACCLFCLVFSLESFSWCCIISLANFLWIIPSLNVCSNML